ncbi:MAG: 2-polyprenyl-3-methyl-6-methoxy-1,4-benzoquinone monooxygenase [Gammaproteobacteria bacterium]|nr:2-polyprenyl-3-methyl-6-methoxy-1,4-benzoquinone monooxygenase [Gammaproteobacteria bacterium]
MRNLSPIDHLVASADNALRTVLARQAGHASRPNPAGQLAEDIIDPVDRSHSAGLMRVNHAGEIAAQALYQGQAVTARNAQVRAAMQESAAEEVDHLAWCEERLEELGEGPSKLAPFWYAGSFAIGALAGAIGDKWSLGFVAETEKQVESHLDDHLEKIAEDDTRSRAIIAQMRLDEIHHGDKARAAGAAELPPPVKSLMKLVSKVMTTTAYRF